MAALDLHESYLSLLDKKDKVKRIKLELRRLEAKLKDMSYNKIKDMSYKL
jgi:hypothetical protein